MANHLQIRLCDAIAPILKGVPEIVAAEGPDASYRFVRFFVETIRNDNTRMTYARAVRDFFDWCQQAGLSLRTIEPLAASAYFETLTKGANPRTGKPYASASVKIHLAAVRELFDFLVTGGIVPFNPVASVKGPRMNYRRGKTPVLDSDDCRQLLNSIQGDSIGAVRDRALIGCMVFSFARVSAAIGMNLEDYRQHGKKSTFRLHEKGGKFNEVPVHHLAEEYLDRYLAAAALSGEPPKSPLFRAIGRDRQLTSNRLNRRDTLAMIKRRAKKANLPPDICCHTFRGTGITTYLLNGGDRSKAAQIAGHASEKTTSLYDRRNSQVERTEIERIRI